MWIESQDEKFFINTKNIKELSISSQNNIYAEKSLIGVYSSEKRALEILNEIKGMVNDPDNYTYKMPKE